MTRTYDLTEQNISIEIIIDGFYSSQSVEPGPTGPTGPSGLSEILTGDALSIDNRQRDPVTEAIISGVLADNVIDQRVRVNARLNVSQVPEHADNAAALAAGLSIGEIYRITGSDHLGIVH